MDTFSYIIGIEYDEQLTVNTSSESTTNLAFEEGINRNTLFQEQLLDWLSEQGLEDDVSSSGEPLCFPILSMQCSQKAAEAIKSFPGVTFVNKDGL